ncbi:MAG TPA: hypothetical protein ENK45_04035 [Aliiroseovarius sp.]|nr:hypothetical protein [Aliiroseovarius sp.]
MPLRAPFAFALLFLLVLSQALPAPARAQPALRLCAERYEAHHYLDPSDHFEALAGRECWLEEQGTLRRAGVPYQILAETVLDGDPGEAVTRQWLAQVRAGLEIADQALIKLGPDTNVVRRFLRGGPIGSQNKVFVILASEESYDKDGNKAQAYVTPSDGDCYMVITPDSRQLLSRPGAMGFIMSHELFHCVQAYSIPDYLTSGDGERADWWVESSAHWFAHMAQPSVVVETYSKSANVFEAETPRKTMRHFDYSAWPFFAWLAQEGGNARAVMDFLLDLPGNAVTDSQVAELLTPEEWGAFARDYASYNIRVSPRVPVDPRPRARLRRTNIASDRVGEVETYRFARRTGALERYRLRLGPGEWELSTVSSGAMYLAPAPGGGDPVPDAWQTISGPDAGGEVARITVPCGKDQDFVLAGFGSADGSPRFALDARKTGDPCQLTCDNVPTTRDSCLYGLWEEVDPVIVPDLRQRMQALIPQARARGAELEIDNLVISFFPDSNVSTVDMRMRGAMDLGGMPASAELHAQGTARWGTSGGRLIVCAQGVEMQTTIRAGGRSRTTPQSFRRDATWLPNRVYRYSCSGGTLRLTDTETGARGRMVRR